MKKSIFQGADGKSLFVTFALVTSLFLLWGFCNGLIDLLNSHFQNTLHISKAQSGFVQFANYIGYFLMAFPAGMLAQRFGYKGGIIIGLILIAAGAFWFIEATKINTYWAFLTGLFVLATGMTCLETIANPYTTVLGPAESGATRINIAQTFNGLGWVLGPIVGGHLIFNGPEGANANANLYLPYLGIGVVVAALICVFFVAKVPDLHAEEGVKEAGQNVSAGASKPASPAMGIMDQLSYLMRTRHFSMGVGAQFLYVAAQTGIFSFFINYVLESDKTVTKFEASQWLGMYGFVLFMVGRMCGSAVVSLTKPHRALAAYAVINVVLTAVAMSFGGKIGLVGLLGTFFFMSIMFPTIFALSIRGLGEHTKLGSSLLVMSIVGGAVAPPLMGWIADIKSMRVGFVLPLVCFVLIAVYGMVWRKLLGAETPVATERVQMMARH